MPRTLDMKLILFIIVFSFEIALIIPLGLGLTPPTPRTMLIHVTARQYGYTPSRIVANKGDTIILELSSLDVPHGFAIDGYPIDLIVKKGITFQKHASDHTIDKRMIGWGRVASVKFVAGKTGKFVFRCTQTCGNLHPFMTGELVVKPNTSYNLFIALSLWITFSQLLWLRYGNRAAHANTRPNRRNILEGVPWLERLTTRRGFQFFIILPNFIIFYLFILSSLWGSPVGNRNIAIVFVWILWWFLLKAVFVPMGGRLWCMICPLPAPAEWLSRKSLTTVKFIREPLNRIHHRFSGLQKDWPVKMRNIWLQNILFLALISFGMILITRPFATALMFLGILALTFVLALIYRHRVFCLYLCPVGGFLGTYSMASMTEIRAVDPDVCRKHRSKTCLVGGPGGWACPWNQYVGKMNRNNYCGLCTECIKSCPKSNVGFFLRPFGSDRRLKGYDEMFNVIIMLVVALAFSITMLGPWGFIKDAANITEMGQIVPFIAFLSVIWGAALLLVPGIFQVCAWTAHRLSGYNGSFKEISLRLATILIPVGIFAWIAFSLPAITVNYGHIISVLSDPLGLGWDLFNTAGAHFHPLIPEWIPVIQGLLILSGLYLGIRSGIASLFELFNDARAIFRAMLAPAVLTLLICNIFLKLFTG